MSLWKKILIPAMVLGIGGWVEAKPLAKTLSSAAPAPMTAVSSTKSVKTTPSATHKKTLHKKAVKASKTSTKSSARSGKTNKRRVVGHSHKTPVKHASKASVKSKPKAHTAKKASTTGKHPLKKPAPKIAL